MKLESYTFDNGETWDAPEDWVQFVRDALARKATYPRFGTRDDDDVDRRLYELFGALMGSGAEVQLADAVLRVMETGSPEERAATRFCPYPFAPNVGARVDAMLTHDRDVVLAAGLIDVLLERLFAYDDERARELFRAEVARSDVPDLGPCAMQYDFDWFVDHLPPYQTTFELRFWMRYLSREQEDRLLDGMSRVDGYANAMRELVFGNKYVAEERAALRARLLSHPIAKNWVD